MNSRFHFLTTAILPAGALALTVLVVHAQKPVPDSLEILFTWEARGQIPILDPKESESGSDTSLLLSRWSRIAEMNETDSALVLDCGNTFFPGTLSRFSFGTAMNEILDQAGVAAKRVTSRDFLMGREVLENLGRKGKAAFLAGNLADDHGKPLFPGSMRFKRFGLSIEIYSLLDPKGTEAASLRLKGFSLTDPVVALQKQLANSDPSRPALRICLVTQSLLDHYPGLVQVPGIRIFAVGTAPGRSERIETLRNGAQILFVPVFTEGVGTLRIPIDRVKGAAVPFDGFTYSVDTVVAPIRGRVRSDKIFQIVRHWSGLYSRDNGALVRDMSEGLTSDPLHAVAGLLRERTGSEVACLDPTQIGETGLPKKIMAADLERLILFASDLYTLKLTGAELKDLSRSQGVTCVGMGAGGRVEGRVIGDEEIFSVVAPEAVVQAQYPDALGNEGEHGAELWNESMIEAMKAQLSTRSDSGWDFSGLDRRWRVAGEIILEGSRRDDFVGNRDSVKSIPSAVGEKYSAWDGAFHAPMKLYNRSNSFDFNPEAEYSRANGQVGENFLGLRLDYSYGRQPLLRPYTSLEYQSYLGLVPGEARPARLQASAGAKVSWAEWIFSLGAVSGKTLISLDPNPFAPAYQVFAVDTAVWDRGVEFIVTGSSNLGEIFHRHWPGRMKDAELDLNLDWNNFLGASHEGGHVESRLRMDLSAVLLPSLHVNFGWRMLYAYLFRPGSSIYNLEPSVSFSLGYHFKASS